MARVIAAWSTHRQERRDSWARAKRTRPVITQGSLLQVVFPRQRACSSVAMATAAGEKASRSIDVCDAGRGFEHSHSSEKLGCRVRSVRRGGKGRGSEISGLVGHVRCCARTLPF